MKKIPLVNLVRTFAIWAVLAHHLGLARIAVDPSYHPLAVLWFKFWANGYFGVSLFFVVSRLSHYWRHRFAFSIPIFVTSIPAAPDGSFLF